MTTKAKSRRARRADASRPPQLTLGPWVRAWIEKYLVHSEGDYLGEPFRFDIWQKPIVDEMYRIDEAGSRVYDRVVLGLPKGNGKTEVAAAISVAELAGPVSFAGWDSKGRPRATKRKSADIPVAAASMKQANTLFGAAKTMIERGPLAPMFETYDTVILPRQGAGILERVAAEAGTNDGRRPSCFIADEVHEWEGRKARVHLVLSNGRAKRRDAWELSISTAGSDDESLLAGLYQRGLKGDDPRLLMIWFEPTDTQDDPLDLEDPEQRMRAIREANPACGTFLDESKIEARYHEIAEHEFRRYYLNQWTSVPEQWITPQMWDAAADTERVVERGLPIALGFDGSYNQDSTALVGCTIEEHPHVFRVGLWEKPEGVREWVVDEAEVIDTLLEAVRDYDVQSVPSDDTFGRIWSKALGRLADDGVPVVEWPTRSPSRMAPACGQFWGTLKRAEMTHDGDPELREHFMNCRTKTDRFGPRIVKESRKSTKRIDGAVAGVIAHDMAVRLLPALDEDDGPLITVMA